jgi:hypothetical protein
MAMAEQPKLKKRGIRDVIVGVVSAAMIMSPSYLADLLMSRAKLGISIAAVLALAVFLVGVFLMVQLLRD